MLLVTLLIFVASYAQDNAIDKYFKQHLDNPAFSKFSITKKSFELITEIETDDPDEQRVLEAIGKIDGILVLMNEHTQISKEYYTEAAAKLVPDQDYQDLLVVEHQEDNVRFLIREDEEAIREFVIVAGEENNFVIGSIYGEIDLASISKLADVIRDKEHNWFDLFKNVDTEELVFGEQPTNSDGALKNNISKTSLNNLQLRIFPNPATDFINIAPEGGVHVEMEVGFYSLLGEKVQHIGKVQLPYRVKLNELPAGAYFLRLTDEAGVFRNFRIVKPVRKN